MIVAFYFKSREGNVYWNMAFNKSYTVCDICVDVVNVNLS